MEVSTLEHLFTSKQAGFSKHHRNNDEDAASEKEEHGRCSMSRNIRYAGGRSIWREDSRYGRTRCDRKRSRSRDCGRQDYSERRSRDSSHRRRRSRSRSRGGYGQHVRHSRSKEIPRLYGSGQHAQGDKDDQNLRHMDLTIREEDNQEDYQDNAEEDIEKQVEKIRLRRQEILEKHKQEQSERVGNAKLGASDDSAAADAKLSLDENASVVADANLNDFIFGESPARGQKLVIFQTKCDGLTSETNGLSDNWDDAEGYYCHRIGEVLDGRYEVAASHGRGVSSSVVRARALGPYTKDAEEVAIKIIRNNDVMLKCGQQELNMLKMLDGADPDNRRHCVSVLVLFEPMGSNCLLL